MLLNSFQNNLKESSLKLMSSYRLRDESEDKKKSRNNPISQKIQIFFSALTMSENLKANHVPTGIVS